ncbi:hypothetical protein EW145_g1101 [Phellinidium pouzarii]|uniref:Ketoreductase (KR) domain-containing protein n=1 Tax=Phellinidium pouzarii TaxID=167371 RepID=A0A4S4LL92_9AGAM|nr:hypothetical protein EW145_g1101 [Phellinidium pouzarii]
MQSSSINLKMSALTDLTGKVALRIQRAHRGLMIAGGLASSGAKVYITGRRFEILQEAADKFNGDGMLVPLRMDVTDKSSILAVVETIQNADGKLGKLDVLVNNAAVAGPRNWTSILAVDVSAKGQTLAEHGRELFDIQSFEEWDAVARANVASIFFVTTAFLGLLDATSSWAQYAYISLKAATKHLTHVFATELSLKRAPICVNAISPGLFPSEMTATAEELKEAVKTSFGNLRPIPVMRAGREDEIAALAVFLASPASAYMHGQDIVLDGGLSGVNP